MYHVRLGSEKIRVWLAGLGGALTYCLLYVAKNVLSGRFVKGFEWSVTIVETMTVKLPVTLVNAVIATVCAAVLYFAMAPALRHSHVLRAE